MLCVVLVGFMLRWRDRCWLAVSDDVLLLGVVSVRVVLCCCS